MTGTIILINVVCVAQAYFLKMSYSMNATRRNHPHIFNVHGIASAISGVYHSVKNFTSFVSIQARIADTDTHGGSSV